MKIVVLTAIWKRHELFEIFKLGFKRINKDSKHELIFVSIGSEDIEFSDNHIETPNQPLSDKWQSGIDYIKEELDFDYILMLGSDDIICSNLLDVYTPAMEANVELIGLIDCYFLDARVNTFKYWKGYTNNRRGESIGMARMLSKDLLIRMNWNIWKPGLKKGLDRSMMNNLRHLKPTKNIFNCKEENIVAIDIKTDINVSNINTYSGLKLQDFNSLSNYISEEEFYSILKLK